jgi:hypothetical protein
MPHVKLPIDLWPPVTTDDEPAAVVEALSGEPHPIDEGEKKCPAWLSSRSRHT